MAGGGRLALWQHACALWQAQPGSRFHGGEAQSADVVSVAVVGLVREQQNHMLQVAQHASVRCRHSARAQAELAAACRGACKKLEGRF
jgi:hypothetical protein